MTSEYQSKYADKDIQKKLIESLNFVCEFVSEKLPEGWEIQLSIQNGEATASLLNIAGDEIEVTGSDFGISSIDEMCVTAIESIENENL